MSEDQAQRQPLTIESTDLSGILPNNSYVASPQASSPPRHRPGYARVPSTMTIEEHMGLSTGDNRYGADDDIAIASEAPTGHGLGINTAMDTSPARPRRVSIHPVVPPRVPLPYRKDSEQQTPGSAEPLMSPPSTCGFSGSTQYEGSRGDFDLPYSKRHNPKRSESSLQSSIQYGSELDLIHKHTTASLRSAYYDFTPKVACQSRRHVYQGRGNWLSTTLLLLSIFSTFGSAAYLIIALRGPRYGRLIHTNGRLDAATASLLTSFFAKLIELSFVTVFVAFLGQVLSRRAFAKDRRHGVTLAEMSMRSWIMQPGTMITHWESVRYAVISVLGIISLLTAVMTMLYTTASTSLVAPQLKFSKWENRVMQGLVKTEFSNPTYIQDNCQTPITSTMDPLNYGATCIQIEHAAQGYHNYQNYLAQWTAVINNGSGAADLPSRPKGIALFNDNTTITAPWVEIANMTTNYHQSGYIINNVSMAMPHAGVVQAASDAINDIMQPQDLDGQGIYSIRASVPSPVVHVLCAAVNQSDLEPMIYEDWGNTTYNATLWPYQLAYADPYLNLTGTPLAQVFNWGPEYGMDKVPPVFGQRPLPYNTILNDTLGCAYGRDSIYLLGAVDTSVSTSTEPYFLCSLKVSQTPFCSTQYNASSSGATLEAICEDPNDDLEYIKSLGNATSGNSSLNLDWVNIASEWGHSLSLNGGTVGENASNARLLSQLSLLNPYADIATPELDPSLPSPAEALAVMAGCTLLMAVQDSPFVEFFNYSGTTGVLTPGQYQYFNASIRAQQYASGGTANYEKAFFLVLFTVFFTNVVVLIYFLTHREMLTDFSEPPNLFSLAVNSPPSVQLAGSCGGGPEGEQYRVRWFVNEDGEHVYMQSQEPLETLSKRRRKSFSERFEMSDSPITRAYAKLSQRRDRV